MRRAKALQLVGFMHRKCIITSDEHQQLTNPQTTDLMRGNLLTRILMGKEVHWLLKFCHCLLESYESERGLDIHYTLLQRIKGECMYTVNLCTSLMYITVKCLVLNVSFCQHYCRDFPFYFS